MWDSASLLLLLCSIRIYICLLMHEADTGIVLSIKVDHFGYNLNTVCELCVLSFHHQNSFTRSKSTSPWLYEPLTLFKGKEEKKPLLSFLQVLFLVEIKVTQVKLKTNQMNFFQWFLSWVITLLFNSIHHHFKCFIRIIAVCDFCLCNWGTWTHQNQKWASQL